MAAVQLKDLMDPLVKIQKSTEDTSNKIDKLIQVITGSSSPAANLDKAVLSELQVQTNLISSNNLIVTSLMETMVEQLSAQTQLLKNIAGSGGGLSSLFGKGGGGKSKLGESGDALKLLGAGTAEMAKALILFTFIPKKTVVKFQTFVVDIFKTLTEYDQGEIKKGAANLMLMGDAIMNFSKSLALSALLIIPGLIAIPFLVVAIGLMSGVMWLMGNQEKNIKKGAKALDRVGDGIKSFAIGMAFFAVTTFFILMEPKILLGMAASLLLVGGAVAILGAMSKNIKKGSGVLRSLGLNLGLFSLGYAVFAFVTSSITMDEVKIQAFIIGGLGLIAMILGKRSKDVAKGSFALSLLGVGLAAFSLGYSFFNKEVSGMTFTDVGVQLLLLGGIVGIVGIVSMIGVGTFIKGSIALALLGPALWAFSWGYSEFAENTKGLSFADVGIQLLILGGVMVIATLAGLAMSSGLPALGALAIALLGPALWAFGWGYSEFAEVTKGLSFADIGVQLLVLGGITVVASIAGALMMAAGVPALGALAIALLGPALWAFSWGYSEFAKATEDANMESVKTQLLLLGGMVVVTSLAGLALPLVFLGAISLGLIGLGVFGLSFGLRKYKEIGWTLDDSANLTGTISSLLTAFGAVPPGGAGGGGGDAGFFGFLGDMGQTVGNIIKGGLGAIAVIANALSLIVIGASVATLAMGLKPYKELGWQDSDTDTLTHLMKSLMGVFSGSGEGGGVLSALGGLVKSGINAASATVNTGIFFVASKVIPALAKGLKSYSDVGWNMDKTKILIGSMLAISKSVSKFDDISKNSTSRFMSTMTTLSNNADGLMNAADGVKAIADAINSVDVTKADSMSKFFGAATEYSKSSESDAMESLIETVAEIRDSINSLGQSSIQVEGTAVAAGGESDNKSLGESLASLQITLNQINATMSNLPADIAAIEIRLPQD